MGKKLAQHGGAPVRDTEFPAWPVSGPREEELLRQVLFSGQWGGYHPFIGDFEKVFAGLHDAEHGIAVANGTVALELALEALGIGDGDEVIVPAHSFIATATAVNRVGATPVFVDIERETFNINPREVERAIGAKTRAVIAVHFGGLTVDLDEFERIARNYKIHLIEDAAHAHGAEWAGRRAGGVGIVGTFSFQNSKAMTSGEGGIVVTSDAEVAARCRSLANCGRRPDAGWFDHFELGSNLRLSAFQAAVLIAQLERLSDQIRLRGNNRALLQERMLTPGVFFQNLPKEASTHTHYLLTGWIDEEVFGASRDDFVEALNAEGVPCRPFYPHPLFRNPLYKTQPRRVLECPVADQASKDSFWIPQRVLMGSEHDAEDVVKAIRKIYDVYKPPKKNSVQ